MEIRMIGVDYGAKLSGSTAICYRKDDKLILEQVEKKADADLFLRSFIGEHNITMVCIDAPLSLPEAYCGSGNDYFFRQADREAGAMSPMFLGGLTARAMSLVAEFEGAGIQFKEVWPRAVSVAVMGSMHQYYKKKVNTEYINALINKTGVSLNTIDASQHQIDALLCWLGGVRILNGTAGVYGSPKEGLIYY